MIEIKEMGDQAILVNVEPSIDPEVNKQIIRLVHAIQKEDLPGIRFWIPAYCSLTVGYDPEITSKGELKSVLLALATDLASLSFDRIGRKLKIPVCYESVFAPDMEAVKKLTGLSSQIIIDLHTSSSYQVYMIGFLPGFAYMGILPKELRCPRKQVPRLKVPKGSVGLAGLQTGIYPSSAPGGWQLIGRTPIPAFQVNRREPFLFQAGDSVQFRPISAIEYTAITAQISSGVFAYSSLYE